MISMALYKEVTCLNCGYSDSDIIPVVKKEKPAVSPEVEQLFEKVHKAETYFGLMKRGWSEDRIAREHGIKISTVKKHILQYGHATLRLSQLGILYAGGDYG